MGSNNFATIFELVHNGEMVNTQQMDIILKFVKWRNKRRRGFDGVISCGGYLKNEAE